MIKISIIVPVYNVEKYLADCLDSVLKQSFSDFEIVCVDDGSMDESSQILNDYKLKDSRIIVIRQANAGLSEARNTGLDIARGEYICFLDADDMLEDNALEIMSDSINNDSADIFTYEAELLFEEGCESLKKSRENYYYMYSGYENFTDGRTLFSERVKNDEYVDAAWLLLIRNEWLKKSCLKFMPGALYEDSVFVMQCHFACKNMRHLHRRLYCYRIRKDSIMTRKPEERNVFFRIWQTIECMRYVFVSSQNEDEALALSKQSQFYTYSAVKDYIGLERDEKKKLSIYRDFSKELYRFLSVMMDDGWGENDRSFKSLILSLQKQSEILIFGAGTIGKKIFKAIKENNLSDKVIGFAVSDSEMCDEYEGLPVKCINDYKGSPDCAVVVASAEWNHKSMILRAAENGFQSIFPVSFLQEVEMDQMLEGTKWAAK